MRGTATRSRCDLTPLLSPAEQNAISRLRLVPRRNFSGATRGDRLTQRKGMSTEFSDYRTYAEGDDLRHVDWNVLARLGVAVTKTYRDEQDLCVHVLLDRSNSMQFGEPSKGVTAARLAYGLSVMALMGGDTLYVSWLGGRAKPLALRGRHSVSKLSTWILAGLSDGSAEPLHEGVERFWESGARAGVAVVVSDGLDQRLPNLLPAIAARGHDLMFLQILSPIELDPDIDGDLRLVDSETGESVELTANSYALTEYRRALDDHLAATKTGCERGGGRYVLATTSDDLLTVFTHTLKRYGWVRS
jgi:uncharacterized protein (DUF58 family)